MRVGEIGEFGLINRIKRYFEPPEGIVGIGDDCAVIPFGEKELLVTTDALVEGVHFFENSDPYLLGRKSLSVNISDIAAMAGEPKWAFLSLSINRNMDLKWIDEFVNGFSNVAEDYGVYLLGGDTTSSDRVVINVTVVGENDIGESLRRDSAKIGDVIAVTGRIGCSYAGLVAIERGLNGFDELKLKHLNPKPRVVEALRVKSFANAMIDISDGLVQDCGHICRESKVGVRLYWEKIPFCCADFVTQEEMLCGGEDYELLVCIERRFEEKVKGMGDFVIIGEVVNGDAVEVIRNGEVVHIENCGYKHF